MAEPKKSFVTIVPPPASESGLTLATGTKVMLDDGSQLGNVYKVELKAEAMGLWEAVIHLRPKPNQAYTCLARLVSAKPMPWWRKVLLKAAGVKVVSANTDTSLSVSGDEYWWESGLVTEKDQKEG